VLAPLRPLFCSADWLEASRSSWSSGSVTAVDASWVPEADFHKLYPNFKLEDELVQQEGRGVMVGLLYRQRNNTVGNRE
jgi:hypothetical protein